MVATRTCPRWCCVDLGRCCGHDPAPEVVQPTHEMRRVALQMAVDYFARGKYVHDPEVLEQYGDHFAVYLTLNQPIRVDGTSLALSATPRPLVDVPVPA